MNSEKVVWQCEVCETKLIEEDRGNYKKRYEIYGSNKYITSKRYRDRARDCSHPRRIAGDGTKFCARCGRGPLKQPLEINGEILGPCCRDRVPIAQEVVK